MTQNDDAQHTVMRHQLEKYLIGIGTKATPLEKKERLVGQGTNGVEENGIVLNRLGIPVNEKIVDT